MAARKRMLALTVLILLALAPGLVQAGGWTVVILDQTLEDVRAGEEFQVGFMVLQHGEQPIGGLEPRIDLNEAVSGQQISFTARPEGQLGHYVADLTLPSAGTWMWTIETFGPPATLSPLVVGEAVPVVQPERIPTGLPQSLVALVVALALVASAGLLVYRRRQSGAETA